MDFPDRDILRIFKTVFKDRSFNPQSIKFNVKKFYNKKLLYNKKIIQA
jgi:hypothetical protein